MPEQPGLATPKDLRRLAHAVGLYILTQIGFQVKAFQRLDQLRPQHQTMGPFLLTRSAEEHS